jgi:hypothetical protein
MSKLYHSQDHDTTKMLTFVSKETQDFHALSYNYKVENYIVQGPVKEQRVIGEEKIIGKKCRLLE